MIKCPNCGSTAQVKETFSNYSTILGALCKSYRCGCGCYIQTQTYDNGTTIGTWKVKEKNK